MSKQLSGKRVGMDLTQGSILRNLILFAIPIVLADALQQMYSLVDLLIIGRFVGDSGTVGVSVGGELIDLLTPVATAFSSAGQIYMAQLVGAKDDEKIKKTIGTLLSFMMVFAVGLAAASIVLRQQILMLLNCPEEAYLQAVSYMTITALGVPFIFGYNAISSILRAMGESKRPLMFVAIAATVNIFADILLVVVFRMEAAGTAIATVLSQFGSFAAAFVCLYRNRGKFGIEFTPAFFRIDKNSFLIIIKLGIPQLTRILFVRFSMLWVNSNINSYGLVVSSTNAIGNKFQKLCEIFIQSLVGAEGAILGQNLGAKNYKRAEKTVWCTMGFAAVYVVIIALIYLFLPKQIYGLFTDDPQVIEMGIIYLRIMIVHLAATAFNGPFRSMVNSCGFVTLSMVLGILDGVVFKVGFGILFGKILGMGALGYFWATGVSRIIPAFISFCYFMSGRWRKRALLSEGKRKK